MLPENVLIIDNGSIYLPELKRLIGSSLRKVVQPGETDVAEAEGYDLIVLSGGYQHEVMESEKYYRQEIKLIKTTRVPVIGICLGFQLIAHTFGMPIHKRPRTENKILVIQPSELGAKLFGAGPFHVYEDHRWVVSKTPEDFHSLAVSKDGIEALQHTSRPLVGFQFHPEMFVSKTDGKMMLLKLFSSFS